MDRIRRVNELLKRELGHVFERLVCVDFVCLITVTGVKTSPDLHHATVFVSVYGSGEQQQEVMNFLRKRRGEIQKEVSRAVTLKYTPVLQFRLDSQAEKADSVMRILEELEQDEQL